MPRLNDSGRIFPIPNEAASSYLAKVENGCVRFSGCDYCDFEIRYWVLGVPHCGYSVFDSDCLEKMAKTCTISGSMINTHGDTWFEEEYSGSQTFGINCRCWEGEKFTIRTRHGNEEGVSEWSERGTSPSGVLKGFFKNESSFDDFSIDMSETVLTITGKGNWSGSVTITLSDIKDIDDHHEELKNSRAFALWMLRGGDGHRDLNNHYDQNIYSGHRFFPAFNPVFVSALNYVPFS